MQKKEQKHSDAVTSPSSLRFHKDQTFRILMISDLHSFQLKQDALMVDAMETFVAHSQPDFVMIGGDLSIPDATAQAFESHAKDLLSPILRRGLPWAAVHGNHDCEMPLSLAEQEAIYERIPGCMSQAGPKDVSGLCNYCLEVLSSEGDRVAFHLWALDSHSAAKRSYPPLLRLPEDTCFSLPNALATDAGNGGMVFNQVEWYYRESMRREAFAKRKIPAIMFFHTPIPEFELIPRNPIECEMVGEKNEPIACAALNSGIFTACLERGDVRGIFCGHSHFNNFHGKYCGVTLGFDAWVYSGCRIIELHEDGTFKTDFIRLDDLKKQ